jgi:hypothetical protein
MKSTTTYIIFLYSISEQVFEKLLERLNFFMFNEESESKFFYLIFQNTVFITVSNKSKWDVDILDYQFKPILLKGGFLSLKLDDHQGYMNGDVWDMIDNSDEFFTDTLNVRKKFERVLKLKNVLDIDNLKNCGNIIELPKFYKENEIISDNE